MKLYEKVRLLSDRYQNEGAKKDDTGYVIEIYDDGNCEVEFADHNGVTFAQIVVNPDEIESEQQS